MRAQLESFDWRVHDGFGEVQVRALNMTDQGSPPEGLGSMAGEVAAQIAGEASARRLMRAVSRLSADPAYVLGALAAKLESLQPIEGDQLSQSDRDYLVESGAFSEQEMSRTEARVQKGSIQLVTIQGWLVNLLDTLSVDEVSGLLDCQDDDALRRDIAEGRLYAVEVSGQLRFPRWQFDLGSPGNLLPGLDRIVEAISPRWGWQTIAGFMLTPQSDLTGEGRRTPVEWLRGGGDVAAVTGIVKSWSRA